MRRDEKTAYHKSWIEKSNTMINIQSQYNDYNCKRLTNITLFNLTAPQQSHISIKKPR